MKTNPVQTIEAPVDADAERLTSPGVHLSAIAERYATYQDPDTIIPTFNPTY